MKEHFTFFTKYKSLREKNVLNSQNSSALISIHWTSLPFKLLEFQPHILINSECVFLQEKVKTGDQMPRAILP